MKPLVVELTKGTRFQFQSLGWKAPRPDACRRQFYALDQTGKPVVVTPKPAMPEFYDPNQRAKAVFNGEPFPEEVCIEISPCRLLAPPCYESWEDYKSQLPCHQVFEPWKWVYSQTHKEALVLEPADDGPLCKRLNAWLAGMAELYKKEAAAWRGEISRVKSKPLGEIECKAETERATKLAELREQLAIVESEQPIDGVPCKGRLNLTLDDVKKGREGIRDAWMHEDWAAKNDKDLRAMFRERIVLRAWLEKHTGTPANIIDAASRPTIQRWGIVPPTFGEKYEQDPRFLEACARVRYRARFANSANSVVYLADCELREELDAQEIDEVAKLKASTRPAQVVCVDAFTHSPDYRALFWNDNGTKVQANLSKTQASAFSALHNAHGFTLARGEWQQEIYGDEPPNDFRPDKIFKYRDGRKVWERFIKVDGDRYRLAIDF